MSRAWKRPLGSIALAGFVVFLGFAAAGCGSSGEDGGSSATEIPGLGSSLDEIKQKAREEGEVDIVQWAGYAQLVDEFKQQTGCTVKTKDGPTSDDMISLITSGQYDGVSASGNASVRLMERGDVAPVDTDLIPNYADVQEGIKNQPYNSKDDQPYGVPHGRGPNLLGFNSDAVTPEPTTWDPVWEGGSKYEGKISVYDSSIYIADAALHLMTKRPELGIKDPYQLNEEQFNEAIKLLEAQKANGATYWAGVTDQVAAFTSGDAAVGTTWQYQLNLLGEQSLPVKGILPDEGSTGWSDTWMLASKAKHPNCMLMWMDHMMSPEANGQATVWFGEAPTSPQACDVAEALSAGHCELTHADDEAYYDKIWYWATPQADCADDDAATTCKDQDDWVKAWTTLRGA